MRQLKRVTCSGVICSAAFTATVLALSACGSTSASTGASPPSAFPLTITRNGGIAGFQDQLVVAGNGLVSITQKGQAPRQCRLTPEASKRLTAAATQVPWPQITPGSTTAAHPDDLVTMVSSPAGGPVRVEDPHLGAAGVVFNDLISDLNGGRSASGMCAPV